MRVLYISTAFPTENEGSTIYTDLAAQLRAEGHQVTVAVAEGKAGFKTRLSEERGLQVLRIKVDNYYNVGLIKKGLAALTISGKMISGIKKHLRGQLFDFILFESPPVSIHKVVGWAMKRFNCPSYLMLKDIFPQNGADLEIYDNRGPVFRFFKLQEKRLYNTATYIGCMSQGNKDYVLRHNPFINADKVGIFPNTKKIHKMPEPASGYVLRKKYGIPEDAVVFLLGGNMGKVQGLDFLAEAIIRLKDDKNVLFALVGRGSEKQRIKDRLTMESCGNFVMLDNLPRDEYESFALECDVGLVTLDYRFTIPNYPSRILTYMEYGMPVLCAEDPVADIGDLIRDADCGLVCRSNDIAAFLKNIRELAADAELRKRLGLNGRVYIENNLDVSKSVEILRDIFSEKVSPDINKMV